MNIIESDKDFPVLPVMVTSLVFLPKEKNWKSDVEINAKS